MLENIHEAKVFVESRDNDVDVELCDVMFTGFIHYFNVQKIA